MGAEDISYGSIMLLVVLLVPILLLNVKYGLKINKSLLQAVARMIIQLSIVGLYLQYIFEWNNILINLLYLVIMISVASFSILKSSKLKFRAMFIPVFIAILIPMVLMIIYFNYFVVRIDYIFDAKYLITIGGMLLGNCLSGTIIALNGFYQSIRKREKEYFYYLSLGATRIQAIAPYVRESMLSSLNPTIQKIATIGLVSLPGMMTGQILGGSVPFVAIKYQIAIMIAIFIVMYFNILLGMYLTMKVSFDEYDVLDRSIFVE